MKKSAALFSLVLSLASFAGAVDNDPGYGPDRPWFGGRSELSQFSYGSSGNKPLYYRPTQRYHGTGYTVNYRYIPVFRGERIDSVGVNGAANFRTEAFRLATEDIPAWGANSPRITVRDPKSGAPRSAVTTIIRKKTTTQTTGAAPVAPPAITPAAESPVPAVPQP